MNIEKLNPVPKKILDKIKNVDHRRHPFPDANVRFYSYLTSIQKELVKVTVAVKTIRDVFYCKQVTVHGLHSKECWVRDIEYAYLGGTYNVGWYDHFLSNVPKPYEDGKWYSADRQYYNPYSTLVNVNYLGHFPKYKYSAYALFKGKCILDYLRVYEQHPQVELLLKIGISSYVATKISLLQKLEKDKVFRKWLVENKEDLRDSFYSVKAILEAYKDRVKILQSQKKDQMIRNLQYQRLYPLIAKYAENDWYRFVDYITEQNVPIRSYYDYLDACEYLELDMTQTKNLYPKEFMRWHDIRIDEAHTKRALKDAEERKKYMANFSDVAAKYLPLQRNKKEPFICLIAQTPEDLIKEGAFLQHCVGKMNYDQKMAKEQSLIFFIRNADEPDKPFVTVEYSLQSNRILQSHGIHNSMPSDEVMTYLNKVWLPYAKRKLKQIA